MEQAAEPTEKKDQPPNKLLVFLAGWLLLGTWGNFLQPFLRYQFWQSDTFWLIETGRLIVQKQMLPIHDPYSFASTAPRWIQYQWLTEIVFAVANSFGGLTGVAVFGAVFLAGLFCILMPRKMVKDGTNTWIAVIVIWLTAFSFFPDLSSLRPQLLSFMLFWFLVTICADLKTGMERWKAALFIFFIAALWANCHISFLAGLLVIMANLVGAWFSARRKEDDKTLVVTFAIMAGAFLLATLFTPYHLELWGYIASVHNYYYTQEVRPLEWAKQPQLGTFALIAFLAQIYMRKKRDLGDWLAFLGLLSVGNNCGRLIIYFCIYACPTIGAALTGLLTPILKLKPLRIFNDAGKVVLKSKAYAWLVVLIAAALVLSQPLLFRKNVPIEAAQYLQQHPLHGNLFCTAHIGSYLIYTSHGSIPVFMDTRMDLYDAEFVKRFADAFLDGKGWKELFVQYKIANALLPNNSKLQLILAKEPEWKQIYQDAEFTLYEKSTSAVHGADPESVQGASQANAPSITKASKTSPHQPAPTAESAAR